MNPETNTQVESKSGKKIYAIILSILVLLAIGISIFFYNKVRVLEQDPNKINEMKIASVVERVSKIIDLPQGEKPVLATISDKEPLANNPFFEKAKVGDEVLLYPLAQKAFIYDPKANIIVEVASLNIGQ